MLENLLFSLNMSLPLFILIGLGYLLRRKGMFTEEYVSRTSSLVYYVLLPAKLFLDMVTADVYAAFEGRYVAAVVAGCLLQFAMAWILGDLLCRDRGKQGAFDQACFRGNFAYLGLVLIQNLYGDRAVVLTAVIMVIMLPAYNIQGAILLTVKGSRGRVDVKGLLLQIFKNPMVLSLLAGMPFALLKIQLPFVVTKSLGYLSGCVSTIALLVVGASTRTDVIRDNFRLLLKACAVKLVVVPAALFALSMGMGLRPAQVVTLTIVAAMPSAVNCYIVADKMGADKALSCGAVVLSHALSIFTLTGLVFLFRTGGLL